MEKNALQLKIQLMHQIQSKNDNIGKTATKSLKKS